MVRKPLAKQGEQLLKQERGGDHCGPGIEPEAVLLEHPATPAELVEPLHHSHRVAERARAKCCGHPPEPGADHDNPASRHAVHGVLRTSSPT